MSYFSAIRCFNNTKNFNILYKEYFDGTDIKFSELMSLYKNTLYLREEHTTIQNIENGFQRMYEFQKSNDKPNYKNIYVNQKFIFGL